MGDPCHTWLLTALTYSLPAALSHLVHPLLQLNLVTGNNSTMPKLPTWSISHSVCNCYLIRQFFDLICQFFNAITFSWPAFGTSSSLGSWDAILSPSSAYPSLLCCAFAPLPRPYTLEFPGLSPRISFYPLFLWLCLVLCLYTPTLFLFSFILPVA